MSTQHLQPKRSFTGRHSLLPASQGGARYQDILGRRAPKYTIISWTFGRGSVIWRIWPAVLLHTFFAAAVVSLSLKTKLKLNIPSVMLTVLGVVIGFVIAYRVGSGYDRFWMGRVCWSDLIRNTRTMSRLVWFHVPPLFSPKTPQEIANGRTDRSPEEVAKVMAEKRLALDLIEGFSVATKHHLRGELGIYFEDLYHLVRPFHYHGHHKGKHSHPHQAAHSTSVAPAMPPVADPSTNGVTPDLSVAPVDSYGTFEDVYGNGQMHSRRSTSALSCHSSQSIQQQPLLPSASPTTQTVMSRISSDLIPFSSLLSNLRKDFWKKLLGGQPLEVLPPTLIAIDRERCSEDPSDVERKWVEPIEKRVLKHAKGHPRVAGEGQNFPLEILHCLSEWCAVLEDRNTVPGNSMAGLLTCMAAMEDNLTTMERILTTPLPFVYSVHISTVWLYLFFLPFQLVDQFGWHSITGVATAAFIYLGFLAAGEEIEQPFGYEDNDLDLDLFCREVVHSDLDRLKSVQGLNAPDQNHHHVVKTQAQAGEYVDDAHSIFGTL